MGKTKAFGCIVLVIASMMVFSLVGVPEVASAYTPTPEDIEFIEWVNRTENEVYNGLLDIVEEKREIYIHAEHFDVLQNIIEIDDYNISSELEPLRREYKLELNEIEEACVNLEEAIDAYEIRYFSRYEKCMDAFIEHTKKALSHREKVRKYLERAREGKALPGFKTIFAIGSLLSVAYLVIRRRG